MGGSSGCVESSRIFEERKRKTKTDSAPIPSLLISPSLLSGGFGAFSALPAGYLGWLIVALGGVDFHMARDYSGNPEFPGDIRNGLQHLPENCRSGGLQLWDNYSEEEKLSKRAIELNNGRAAMMGILALMVHEKLGNLDLILPFGAPGN
jgi:hypothetical protein